MNNEQIKAWESFKNAGLLWFINRTLHLFGYAIVYDYDNGKLVSVTPQFVDYVGFSREAEERGYLSLRGYMSAVSETLLENLQNVE